MTDSTTTITEALAELKTLAKRVAKKREFVLLYLARQEMLKDPLEKEGGAPEAIKRELQAIGDLNERVVAIRRAIAKANAETTLSVNGATRTIAEWLTWRREVAPGHGAFLGSVRAKLESIRKEGQRRGVNVMSATATIGDVKPDDVIVNMSEQELASASEMLESLLGTLDGKLSLKNATTTIIIN